MLGCLKSGPGALSVPTLVHPGLGNASRGTGRMIAQQKGLRRALRVAIHTKEILGLPNRLGVTSSLLTVAEPTCQLSRFVGTHDTTIPTTVSKPVVNQSISRRGEQRQGCKSVQKIRVKGPHRALTPGPRQVAGRGTQLLLLTGKGGKFSPRNKNRT